jgi:hypothetical protein
MKLLSLLSMLQLSLETGLFEVGLGDLELAVVEPPKRIGVAQRLVE